MTSKGKSSSKPKNGDDETQLSGAYIRSLVKQQLTPFKDHQNSGSSNGDGFAQQKPHHHHPHRKQAKRRLHTARPYQEQLLNMAEARREIVEALKFHRASMKQKQQMVMMMESGPGIDHASSGFDNSGMCPISSDPPSQFVQENSILPLNLQGFTNSSVFSSSSSSNSSLPPAGQIPPPGNSGLHPAMDDKEMEEIRSIGEQYQMEWNDAVNSANSAWWSEFLKDMEIRLDQSEEFPAWMNANGSCLQFVNDDYYYPALPW